jgi:hypothetical protein
MTESERQGFAESWLGIDPKASALRLEIAAGPPLQQQLDRIERKLDWIHLWMVVASPRVSIVMTEPTTWPPDLTEGDR